MKILKDLGRVTVLNAAKTSTRMLIERTSLNEVIRKKAT